MIPTVQRRVLFIFCAVFEMHSQSMCALKGYTGTVTGFSTSCSLQCHPHVPLPVSPPFPVTPLLSLLTGQHAGPLCHLSISESTPQGASVTELGAAACCLCLDSGKVPLLPFRLLSFSPALSCSLLLPMLSFTNTDTQNDTHIQSSDSFCQLFPTSASRHKGATPPPPQPPPPLLPPPTVPACHLWSGCQVLRLTCQAGTLTVDPERKDWNQLETDDI